MFIEPSALLDFGTDGTDVEVKLIIIDSVLRPDPLGDLEFPLDHHVHVATRVSLFEENLISVGHLLWHVVRQARECVLSPVTELRHHPQEVY